MLKKIISVLVGVLGLGLLAANSQAQSLANSYQFKGSLQRAMVVGLVKGDKTTVEPVASDAADRLFGVVVGNNDTPLSVSTGDSQVLVATSGQNDVLVSVENGAVKVGDYLTASSVTGVAMKADENQSTIIGRALESFGGSNSGRYVSTVNVKDTAGKGRDVAIGIVKTEIAVASNPLRKVNNNVPNFLRSAGESIAGHQVSVARIYIAALVMIISGAISGALIYSGVRGSIISIGRNPLSKTSILRSLSQVIFVSVVIFFSGLVGVYLLLKL